MSLNMMKRNIILPIVAALAVSPAMFSANAQQINPITRAMLEGYEEILKENPNDYQTYYERAAQLYRLSQYDRAINDVTKALQLTPDKEKDLRISELTLLANTAVEMKNYEVALKAVEESLALDPDSYANLYLKGNVCLLLNRPEEAYKAYSGMQRLKSRSQEAYLGMAKANVMMGNKAEAEDLVKEIEAADPSNYLTYCRVGDLYMDMEQPENAASKYLIAVSMTDDPSRPLNSLVSLGKSNYPAVAAAFNYAIEKSTTRVPLLYMKGTIANSAGYYNDAADAFTQLTSMEGGNEAAVYEGLARAQYALNHLPDALAAVNKGLSLQATPEMNVLKSEILLGQNQPAQAVMSASSALALTPGYPEALLAKARALTAEKNGAEALKCLNELLLTEPDNAAALLLRGYVNEFVADDGKAAVKDFMRLATEETDTFPTAAMKGIAQTKIGKKLDADATIEKVLKNHASPADLYYAAVYYAQTGNLEKGLEMLRKAIYDGYQNRFDIETANTPLFSIAPLRPLM